MTVTADRVLDDVLDALGLTDDDDTTDAAKVMALRVIRKALGEAADDAVQGEIEHRSDERHYYADARRSL